MRLLFSGFEPATGIRKSPSGELARLWGSEHMIDAEVRAVVLPQVFRECTRRLAAEAASFRPDAILMFGAVPANDAVRVERFALNAEMSRSGDNTGIPVHDRPIVVGGPPAYETTLPHARIMSALDGARVRGRLSHHAGTHVCNSLFYGIRHFLETAWEGPRPAAGFIHVPFPVELSSGIVEDESGLMTWAEIRAASVAVASALSDPGGP